MSLVWHQSLMHLSAQYGVLLILKALAVLQNMSTRRSANICSQSHFKENLKFGLLQVSTRKQFNLYFRRMFSSFPRAYG